MLSISSLSVMDGHLKQVTFSGQTDPEFEIFTIQTRLHLPKLRKIVITIVTVPVVWLTILIAARVQYWFEFARTHGIGIHIPILILLDWLLVAATIVFTPYIVFIWTLHRALLRFRWKGVMFAYLAGLSCFLGLISLLFGYAFRDQPSVLVQVFSSLFLFMGFGLAAVGSRFFKLARQHLARGAEEILADQDKPFILYLRSFEADLITAPGFHSFVPQLGKGLVTLYRPSFWADNRALTFEEIICKGLNTISAVVAIGKPGEPLPLLGAFRKYVQGEAWRAEVTTLIDRSFLVCLLVGKSTGLIWEFEQLTDKSDGRKVLLLILQNAQAGEIWSDFVRSSGSFWVGSLLPRVLPVNALAVGFRWGWKPVVFTGRHHMSAYRDIADWIIRENRLYSQSDMTPQ